jgi:hypothetical protein
VSALFWATTGGRPYFFGDCGGCFIGIIQVFLAYKNLDFAGL